VALFNGYRIAKSTNKQAVKFGDEEWSDFRDTGSVETCYNLQG
jgi:hypothetical protein